MPDWVPKKAASGELRVVYVLLDDARRWDRNPKRHDIPALVSSIQRHGFRDPPIYDAALGAIVAGNGRIESLIEMRAAGAEPPRGVALDGKGRWCAPILVGVDAESKRAAEAFGIDHNALTLAGSDIPPEMVASLFDPDAMRAILADMDAAPVSLAREMMDAEVWVEAHTRGGAEEEAPQPEPQTDRAAELAKEWGTAQGQVWEIPSLTVPGRCHRVVCGDSTQAETYRSACGVETPWMMVTDPPYGVEYDPDWRNHAKRADGTVFGASSLGTVSNDHRAGWPEAYTLFGGDVAYVWHAGLYGPAVLKDLESCDFVVRAQIVWVKSHFAIGRGDYHWQHEPAWYVVRKGKAANRTEDRSQSTTWNIIKPGSGSGDNEATGHGTQKPVECMARPIRNHVFPPGACVYDPFLGSGTTIVAAEREGRICVGAELSPGYVAVILQRLKDMGLEPRRVGS